MANIILFLSAMALVVHSFQKQMIQLYKQYSHLFNNKEKKNEQQRQQQGESDYCAVCLSQLCKGEKIKSLPICKHRYHADCIGAWLKNHTTCPLCRNKVIDHIAPHNNNQQKHVKEYFRDSMVDVLQVFSDLLVAFIYMMLPRRIRDSFPLVH